MFRFSLIGLALSVLAFNPLTQQSCSGNGEPEPNIERRLESVTDIQLDFTSQSFSGKYRFEDGTGNASLEVGEIEVSEIFTCDGTSAPDWEILRNYPTDDNRVVDVLTISAGETDACFFIRSSWSYGSNFDGILSLENRAQGYTNTAVYAWPYYCGNIFPCQAATSHPYTFEISSVTGLPDGYSVLHATGTLPDSPGYTFQLNAGPYQTLDIGTSELGTDIKVYYLPRSNAQADATNGARHLVGLLSWAENWYGDYTFGDSLEYAAAYWGSSQGGLESHPLIQVSDNSTSSAFVFDHEMLHWLHGNRGYLCREDFGTLSEGLVDYQLLLGYAQLFGEGAYTDYLLAYMDEAFAQAASGTSTQVMMPGTCNEVSIEDMYTGAGSDPYYRVPLAFAEFEQLTGRGNMVAGLQVFLERFPGPATIDDLLATLEEVSGDDPYPSMLLWLDNTGWPTPSESLLLQNYGSAFSERSYTGSCNVGADGQPLISIVHPHQESLLMLPGDGKTGE